MELIGDRLIESFKVEYLVHKLELSGHDTVGSPGSPPVWVEQALAEARGGYTLMDGSTCNPTATLNAVTGSPIGGANPRGMYVFFFVAGRGYIGTDTLEPSQTVHIAWKDDTTLAVEYTLYREGDPGCCPTGGSALVRYRWTGDKLVPLDPIPPSLARPTGRPTAGSPFTIRRLHNNHGPATFSAQCPRDQPVRLHPVSQRRTREPPASYLGLLRGR